MDSLPLNQALTVSEAAIYLSVSPTTIYTHARSGRLPAHRVGRAWRFFATELNQATSHDPWARSPQSNAALRRHAVYR